MLRFLKIFPQIFLARLGTQNAAVCAEKVIVAFPTKIVQNRQK
jgi:hypothetical protein